VGYLTEDEKAKWPLDSTSVFTQHTLAINYMDDMKRLAQYFG